MNHGELLAKIEMDYRGRGEFTLWDVQLKYRISKKWAEFAIRALVNNGKLYYNLEFELPIFCFLPVDDQVPQRKADLPLYPGMDLFSSGETYNEVYKQDLPASAFTNSERVHIYKEVTQQQAI
ncbi:MAG: hypothetical protein EP332_04640 [Bacteroidetes bacterium]|nr:MAG: hypothetical protein EP332_04640 [Bacteroidota bacterium]